MARIRSIKPEFWSSEQITDCSVNARLLFIGLWNFADDRGRMPFKPKQIKATIFPADDFTVQDVQGWLSELCVNRLIKLYDYENERYLYVTGWHHQKINRPQRAKYPDPEDGTHVSFSEYSQLDMDQGKDHGREGSQSPATSVEPCIPARGERSLKTERDRTLSHDDERLSDEADERAFGVISLYDSLVEKIFGQPRPWPAQTDITTARRWLEAGADHGMLRHVLHSKLLRRKDRNEDAPDVMRYFDEAVKSAIKDNKPFDVVVDDNDYREDYNGELVLTQEAFERKVAEALAEGKLGPALPDWVGLNFEREWFRLQKWHDNDGFWVEDTWGPRPDQEGFQLWPVVRAEYERRLETMRRVEAGEGLTSPDEPG